MNKETNSRAYKLLQKIKRKEFILNAPHERSRDNNLLMHNKAYFYNFKKPYSKDKFEYWWNLDYNQQSRFAKYKNKPSKQKRRHLNVFLEEI